MQRAYDQLIHDAALQNLDMVLCLDRGGLVGEDGATHHGVFDLAYLNCIPRITIASPINEHDLRNLMFTGSQKGNGVFVIRYPRGKGELKDWRNTPEILPIGKGRKLKDGKDIAVLSIGPIGYIAKEAIKKAQESNVDAAHYDMIFLKPIDEDILHEVGKNYKHVITVENGTVIGGLGTTVSDFMIKNNYHPEIHKIGVPDKFIEHGSIPELYKLCGMNAESIKNVILGTKR
jgi:1-deoxy-D-xylulose-5-phosphate synthase